MIQRFHLRSIFIQLRQRFPSPPCPLSNSCFFFFGPMVGPGLTAVFGIRINSEKRPNGRRVLRSLSIARCQVSDPLGDSSSGCCVTCYYTLERGTCAHFFPGAHMRSFMPPAMPSEAAFYLEKNESATTRRTSSSSRYSTSLGAQENT